MKRAIDETNRRRGIQMTYNQEHGIQPVSTVKAVPRSDGFAYTAGSGRGTQQVAWRKDQASLPKGEIKRVIEELEKLMKESARISNSRKQLCCAIKSTSCAHY